MPPVYWMNATSSGSSAASGTAGGYSVSMSVRRSTRISEDTTSQAGPPSMKSRTPVTMTSLSASIWGYGGYPLSVKIILGDYGLGPQIRKLVGHLIVTGGSPDTISPAFSAPAMAIRYCGLFTRLTASTSPFTRPCAPRALAKRSALSISSRYDHARSKN